MAWGYVMTRVSDTMILERKHVLHIPLYRFTDDELVRIDIDEILDELIGDLHEGGFDSFYISKVQSIYSSRRFDELLITIFSSAGHKAPDEIFCEWFERNNDVLRQEALGFESVEGMVIRWLKKIGE